MPPFDSLPSERIFLLTTVDQCIAAEQTISAAGVVGFDTESKPVFARNSPQTGPHVVQFATRDHAFVLQVDQFLPVDFLRRILESTEILKVGFGLDNDRGPLKSKFGITLNHRLDLGPLFRTFGYKDAMGIKAAVAIVLGRRLRKSKKATTSNWATKTLSPLQLAYAAEDAHAAACVFHQLAIEGRITYPAPVL